MLQSMLATIHGCLASTTGTKHPKHPIINGSGALHRDVRGEMNTTRQVRIGIGIRMCAGTQTSSVFTSTSESVKEPRP